MYLKLPPLKGGMEKHIKSLSQWQIENHHDVTLCFNAGDLITTHDIQIFPKIKLYRLKPQFLGVIIFYFFVCIYLFKNKKHFDVIHIHGDWSSLVFVKLLKNITSAKIVIFSVHGEISHSFTHQKLLPKLLKYVDLIFSTGYESAKVLKSITDTKIVIQPSGINNIFFKYCMALKKDQSFRVITVANLVSVKNLDLILDISKQLKNIKFKIAGEGQEYILLKKRIEDENLVNVSLLGFRDSDEINRLYRDSDCFLLTSLAEGTPTVIMEAMAVGLPIVCSNAGGMEYFLKDYENGFVLKSFNVQEYIEKLELLMREESLRIKIATQNKITAARFSWNNVAQRITTITQEALNEKN